MSHLTEDQFTLIYFGEASPEIAAAEAERAHLASCPQCHENYQRLAQFLDAMRDVPLPQKSPEWERHLWTALAPQVSERLARRRSGFR
jgi:hypothetical protein